MQHNIVEQGHPVLPKCFRLPEKGDIVTPVCIIITSAFLRDQRTLNKERSLINNEAFPHRSKIRFRVLSRCLSTSYYADEIRSSRSFSIKIVVKSSENNRKKKRFPGESI